MSFKKTIVIGLLASAAPLQAQQTPDPSGQASPPLPAQPAPQSTAPSPTGPAVPASEAPTGSPRVEQSPPSDSADEEGDEEEIVVTGRRQRGTVIGDIPPEIQLDSRDIRATGAASITELLDAIAPQTQSGRGRDSSARPVILLNGRRISGFAEIRDIPPEAIQRVDILPEEVALKYGYRAEQRVVNIVLRRRFDAVTARADAGLATDGGRGNAEADANLLRIDGKGRLNVDANYQHSSSLFESERDIGGDLARYRTLLPETDDLSLNATLNRTIFGNVSATLNGTLEATDSKSEFGLFSFDSTDSLARNSSTRTGHLGVTLNGDVSRWQWSFTGNYDRGHNVSRTDRRDVEGLRDRGISDTETASGEFVANGSLFHLPAGDVSTTFRVGAEHQGFESETRRSDVEQQADLSRMRFHGQTNIDLPIASRRNDVLAGIGNLTANVNAEVEHLSDFGTLRTLGYGLNWSPIEAVSVIASVTDEDGAPTMQQLGDPVLATPNVRVFDFTRGETADITQISGGNPDLVADNRRVFKLGLTVRPVKSWDLSITANYTSARTRNAIASFPTATPEIEAAFPDRFERDEDGNLLRIDARPVNFQRTDQRQLRWGINFSKPIASRRPPPEAIPPRWRQRFEQFRAQRAEGGTGEAGAAATAPNGAAPQPGTVATGNAAQAQGNAGTPPTSRQSGQTPTGAAGEGSGRPGGGFGGFGGFGGGRGGGFGGRGGGFGGRQGGRLQFALYHTWRFKDTILIRDGVPELDLLNGSAASSRGGTPRHEIEAQAGIFKNGYGARMTANWQSGTTVRGVPGGGGMSSSDLRFSSLTTFNLRLFANLGEQQLVVRNPWLRGTRVTLSVNNLFNARPRVRDASGVAPLGYLPDELDPLGRSVTISLRKLFF